MATTVEQYKETIDKILQVFVESGIEEPMDIAFILRLLLKEIL